VKGNGTVDASGGQGYSRGELQPKDWGRRSTCYSYTGKRKGVGVVTQASGRKEGARRRLGIGQRKLPKIWAETFTGTKCPYQKREKYHTRCKSSHVTSPHRRCPKGEKRTRGSPQLLSLLLDRPSEKCLRYQTPTAICRADQEQGYEERKTK